MKNNYKNLRRLSCIVTSQTMFHLLEIQSKYEFKNIGEAIDKIVKEYQLKEKNK